MSGIYLSIDLDYWANHCLFSAKQCNTFFQKLAGVNIKNIKFTEHHHGLLRHASVSKCDTLINVDFHSDLTNNYPSGRKTDLNEGTWVNFVSWRKEGSFIWMLPNHNFEPWGLCHDTSEVKRFEDLTFKDTEWKNIKKQVGTRNIKWENVCGVGVSLSPGWLENSEPLRCVLPSLFGKVIPRSKFRLNDYTLRKTFPNISLEKFLKCLAENIQIQKRTAGRHDRRIRENNIRC